ncbi:hypothetical protein GCM10010400_19920 [Streptomyces aculeolatus]
MREVRVDDLDGHGGAARAAAQEDPAHAAGAEPAEHPVRSYGLRITALYWLHGIPPDPPLHGPSYTRPVADPA